MNIITPIIIPTSTETERCPGCSREEEIIEVCAHCGHKYEYEEGFWTTGKVIFATILGIVVFCWAFFTLMEWFYGRISLVEVIKQQWEWLKGLKVW